MRDAASVAQAVRAGTLRAETVAREALAEIVSRDPALNCFTAVLEQRALKDAHAVDEAVAAGRDPGPLAGVPFAVKNLFDVADLTTVAGSLILRDRPPATSDGALVRQMRQAGANVQVAKNSLAQIAVKETDVASIGHLLKGPPLIAHSIDPVAAAKAAVAFAKDNEKFVLLGGAMGKTALNVDGVKALATMPSLDELRGKLVGLIQAPATKLAQLSTAPAAKLARVFGAYAAKDAA